MSAIFLHQLSADSCLSKMSPSSLTTVFHFNLINLSEVAVCFTCQYTNFSKEKSSQIFMTCFYNHLLCQELDFQFSISDLQCGPRFKQVSMCLILYSKCTVYVAWYNILTISNDLTDSGNSHFTLSQRKILMNNSPILDLYWFVQRKCTTQEKYLKIKMSFIFVKKT